MDSDCEIASVGLFSVLETQGVGISGTPSIEVGVRSFTSSLEISRSSHRALL